MVGSKSVFCMCCLIQTEAHFQLLGVVNLALLAMAKLDEQKTILEDILDYFFPVWEWIALFFGLLILWVLSGCTERLYPQQVGNHPQAPNEKPLREARIRASFGGNGKLAKLTVQLCFGGILGPQYFCWGENLWGNHRPYLLSEILALKKDTKTHFLRESLGKS